MGMSHAMLGRSKTLEKFIEAFTCKKSLRRRRQWCGRCSFTTQDRGVATTLPKDGYQSIGSFHSENLADLMAQSIQEYQPPELPFAESDYAPQLHNTNHEDDIRDDFLLDPSWTFLNHGAFGAALKVGYFRAQSWRHYLEQQPLRYFDRDLLPHLAHSTRLLADFVNAPCTQVALLPNVTSGLNSLFSGYAWYYSQQSDGVNVILWDTTYGSVKKMVQRYFLSPSLPSASKNRLIEIPLQSKHLNLLAVDPDTVLESLVEQAVSQCQGKRTLLLLDHTTSNTALTFPVTMLSQLAKQLHPELDVVVDGAHGLLAQDINLQRDLIPHVDAYLTNAHKWCSAPRGVALMYAQPGWHDTVLSQPAIVSHGVDAADLFSRLVWDGCRDYAAALSVPAVLQYWQDKNPIRIRQQFKDQLYHGVASLSELWHPNHSHPSLWAGQVTLTVFDNDSPYLSPMAVVALPLEGGKTSADAKQLQDWLFQQRIEVPVKCMNGKLYVRLSCHIYNRTEDFERLGRAIFALVKR